MDKLNIKARNFCLKIIEERLQNYQQDLNNLKQSAGEETKSSMGDKYETGRSMVQQEMDKLQGRVAELNKLKKVLAGLKPSQSNKVVMGSFVNTGQLNLYISVSLGQLKMDDTHFIAISPATPLAQEIMGLGKGEKVVLNKIEYRIIEVIN